MTKLLVVLNFAQVVPVFFLNFALAEFKIAQVPPTHPKLTPFDRKLNFLSIDIDDDVMITHNDSFQKTINRFLSKKIMKNHEFPNFFHRFGISSSSWIRICNKNRKKMLTILVDLRMNTLRHAAFLQGRCAALEPYQCRQGRYAALERELQIEQPS